MLRMMIASHMSSKEILDDFIETAKLFYQSNVKSPSKTSELNWEVFLMTYWGRMRAMYNWMYTTAWIFEYLKSEPERVTHNMVLVTDSWTAEYATQAGLGHPDNEWKSYTEVYGVDGSLIKEVINRHAVMDSILELKLWERGFVNNQFCYINKRKGDIEKVDYESYRKTFFFMYNKIQNVTEKMKSNTKQFERVGISEEEYRQWRSDVEVKGSGEGGNVE
jgi:hypothetical protein